MEKSSELALVSEKAITSNEMSTITSSPSARPVRLRDVPFMLFQEISAALGICEEMRITTKGSTWRVRALNPNHKATGFPGAIGFQRSDEHHMFAFWSRVPRPDTRDFEDEYPMIRLNGGPQNGGMWAYGSGNYIVEKLYADFTMRNIYLTDPAVRFMGLLLVRGGQLAQNPNVTSEQYWEVERDPNGNYSGDDDD